MTSSSSVFCDWLDVTYSPLGSAVEDLRLWLDVQLFPVRFSDGVKCLVDIGCGVIKIECKPGFHRVSASGSVVSHLRGLGLFDEYLSILAMYPHKVTRLDAACDYAVDGPVFLRSLEARYPLDTVCLQRKALRVKRLYSCRASDGLLTGTWYAGHKSNARVTVRVYDKQAEALDNRAEVLPPTTRVEFTFRKDHGCTLRDAAMPYSLYHQFASPTIVPMPADAAEWVAHGEGWPSAARPPKLPYEVFVRRLETSPELARLAELCSGFGEAGEATLIRAFTAQLRQSRLNSAPAVNKAG